MSKKAELRAALDTYIEDAEVTFASYLTVVEARITPKLAFDAARRAVHLDLQLAQLLRRHLAED
jgi:hypothetical protein